jgi:hypothetical protein
MEALDEIFKLQNRKKNSYGTFEIDQLHHHKQNQIRTPNVVY